MSDSPKIRNGDLLIKIIVENDSTFRRENNDLIVEKMITLKEAVFGCNIEVKGINNSVKNIKLNAGTQSNSEIKFEKEGFENTHGDIKDNKQQVKEIGDFVIKIIVDIPSCTRLNSKDKSDLLKILERY